MSPWLSDLLLSSQSDERLVGLARAGQSRAFTTIVERYRRELLAFALRLSPGRAEDLVQQTFLSAFSALQRDADVRHLRGWLYQILRNLAARESGAWKVGDEIGERDVLAESAEQAAERRMLAVDALGAVAALPATQHLALVQTAIHGRSRTEVADVLGLSEGAVRQLVHRARTTLRAAATAITPLPLVRWFANRSSGGPGLSEVTIGAGTASTAGLTLKLGIGAVLATGVVAGGVVTATSSHRRPPTHSSRLVASDARGGSRRGAHPALATGPGLGSSRSAIAAGRTSAHHSPTSPLGPNRDAGGPSVGAGMSSSQGSLGSEGRLGSSGGGGPGPSGSSGSDGGSGGSDGGGSDGGKTSSSGSDGGGTSGSSGSDGGGTTTSSSDGGGTSRGGGSDGGTVQLNVNGGTDGGSGGSDGGSSGSVTSSTGSGSDGGSSSTSGGDGSGSGSHDGGVTSTGSSGD